jgi:ribosome-associated protein
MAETFIIGSGRSNRQVTAIAEHVRSTLKEQGIRPLNVEGLKDGHWVLMDYGHVIIHLFHEPLRSFYDLEGLWADARRLRPPALVEQERAGAADEGEARPEEHGDD